MLPLKPLLIGAVVVAVAVPVFVIFSLGGSGLPDPAPCPTPAALATPGDPANADAASRALFAYDSAIRQGIEKLMNLRRSFTAQYPTDAFFRESTFRPDFARYADESICTAQQLEALRPPAVDGQQLQIDTSGLDSALNAFIVAMHDGRNAIAQRNVTEYRKWYADISNRLQAVNDAFTNSARTYTSPPSPFRSD